MKPRRCIAYSDVVKKERKRLLLKILLTWTKSPGIKTIFETSQ